MSQVFTQSWLTPKEAEPTNVVQDALENAETYLNDIQRHVTSERNREKVVDALFRLMVDAYIEKFIITVN